MIFGRRRFASAALFVAALLGIVASVAPASAQRVQGAGSTFAQPVIGAWKKSFLTKRADGADFVVDDLGIDYEPVGSLGGIMRLAQPDIDFAATDAPLPPDELDKRDLAQFPVVIGGLAVVANIPSVQPGSLRLSGDLLAQIYLGRIKRWNDAALSSANPGVTLPDLEITPLHRSDGSGSTLTFTRYLAASNADWRNGPGSDTLVAWSAGPAAEGTGGMISAAKATDGTIAYMEFGQAQRERLSAVQLSNAAGQFVAPNPAAFAATAAEAGWDAAKGFYTQLTDVRSAQAYPLTAATFVLMHKTQRSSARTRRTLFFLAHALEDGRNDAEALGYVALPPETVELVKDYWHEVLPGAAGL